VAGKNGLVEVRWAWWSFRVGIQFLGGLAYHRGRAWNILRFDHPSHIWGVQLSFWLPVKIEMAAGVLKTKTVNICERKAVLDDQIWTLCLERAHLSEGLLKC
jgi:hypothetical protein